MRWYAFYLACIFYACSPAWADMDRNENDQKSAVLNSEALNEQEKNHRGIQPRIGANLDILGKSRDFGNPDERQQLILREVELSIEARVTPWLYGFIFMSRPEGEPFEIEEAAAMVDLPWDIRVKVGQYRNEFGLLNTIHEPERPQVSLPLPIVEFLGKEQLREPAVTIGRVFDLSHGKRTGLSLSILNSENDVAFNEAESRDKAYSGKLYFGTQSDALAYQLGASALTGRNDPDGRLTTNAQALDFRVLMDPSYNKNYDYPARFALIGEWLFNQREIDSSGTNRATGAWAILDYQFLPSHHMGLGGEYTEGLLDDSVKSKAFSAHYTWYYTEHARLQFEARHLDIEGEGRGLEFLLQWNIVLGPHSERPFLAILPMDKEL